MDSIERINTPQFAAYLAEKLGVERLQMQDVGRLSGGMSNETIGLRISGYDPSGKSVEDDLVMRVEALFGLLEPYDIAREYKILSGLQGTSVPVAQPKWLEEDTSILGQKFFLMSRIQGEAPGRVAEDLDPDSRRKARSAYVEMMAEIHRVDWESAGLGFLGIPEPPEIYAAREIDRWHDFLKRVQKAPWPELERCADWLRRNAPKSQQTQLIHGDCSLSNYMFSNHKITGVMDWELATLGDPMADVGWYCALLDAYAEPEDANVAKKAFLESYERISGSMVQNLDFWEAFHHFQGASIGISAERFGVGAGAMRDRYIKMCLNIAR